MHLGIKARLENVTFLQVNWYSYLQNNIDDENAILLDSEQVLAVPTVLHFDCLVLNNISDIFRRYIFTTSVIS